MAYVAGWNMPGYMPEMEPETFDTVDEAKSFLIDTLKRFEDDYATVDDEATAENYCSAAEDVNLWSGPDYMIVEHMDSPHSLGLAFWLNVAEDDQ